MTLLQVDWASAEVSEGELTVGFTDKAPRRWRDAFQRTAVLLGDDSWDLHNARSGQVRVSPIHPGEEERVRHFLESLVLEANAAAFGEAQAFGEGEEDGAPDEEDGAPVDEEEEGEPPEERFPDEQMTTRFRDFAAETEGAQRPDTTA